MWSQNIDCLCIEYSINFEERNVYMFHPTATVNIEVGKGGKFPSQCPTYDVACYMMSKIEKSQCVANMNI